MEELEIYQDQDVVYLTAKVEEKTEVFLAVAANETITMNRLTVIQSQILSKHNAKRYCF